MRQAIIAIVLIVVIVAAVVFAVMKTTSKGGGKAKQEAMGAPTSLIDVKTFEKVTLTAGELAKFKKDPDTGYYKDDKGRILAGILTCANCKVEIPEMPRPEAREGGPPPMIEKREAEYKCPKCQASPFPAAHSPGGFAP